MRNLERDEKKQQQQKSLLTEVNAKLKVNGEGNGNENLKKALGLVSKQKFLIHFFTVSAWLGREISSCDVFMTATFSFSFKTW